MPERKIFLWMPSVAILPDRSRFEIDATDPKNATLLYEETFEKLTEEVAQRTKTTLAMFTRALKEVSVDIAREGNTMRIKAAGPADLLTGMMLGEFLFQTFEKNPEKRFWTFVDTTQIFLSTTRLPIRKLYEDYSGQTLEEIDDSQQPVYEISAVRKFLADPTMREPPPHIIERFRQLGPTGKEHMFGYILGYAKATNESLRSVGKALDVPSPGMTDVTCGNCGFQAPAPNSLLEKDAPFTCPECHHEGRVKEGKF